MDGEDRTWQALISTEADEQAPAISPDGQWIAYMSNETGRAEIYVQRFLQLGSRVTISRGGGGFPLWSPDGRELFHVVPPGNRVMVVPVEPGADLSVGNAQVLFEGQYFQNTNGRHYDISPDGQRFLRIKPPGAATTETDAIPEAILVLNWFEELKRLVPVD